MNDVALGEAMLFATLEPCAPGARKPPKKSCAERIVNARIPKVWVGIEDPDPKVDRQGIQYLLEQGVEVNMFDSDLQDVIRKENRRFIAQAEERAKNVSEIVVLSKKSILQNTVDNTSFDDLSNKALESFSKKAKIEMPSNSAGSKKPLLQLGLIAEEDGEYIPTGNGLLLFGKRPQLSFPNALIRTTHRRNGIEIDATTIDGNLPDQTKKSLKWFKEQIGKHLDRSDSERREAYDYPEVIIRETITNAIVHRDYEISGAPILFDSAV